jgi:hypothetical protein
LFAPALQTTGGILKGALEQRQPCLPDRAVPDRTVPFPGFRATVLPGSAISA